MYVLHKAFCRGKILPMRGNDVVPDRLKMELKVSKMFYANVPGNMLSYLIIIPLRIQSGFYHEVLRVFCVVDNGESRHLSS